MTATPGEKILVIKLGALGDFIQALGPACAIRKAHPQAHITLLTTRPFEAFAAASGYFNDIRLDDRPKWHDLAGWLCLRQWMVEKGFTRVYDLQNNDRTQLYFNMFPKTARPEWVGVARGASHRNTDSGRTAGLAYEGHVQTLRLAGIENVSPDDLSWVRRDVTRFNLRGPYALVVPGSSPKHPYKRWPTMNYARLCSMLEQRGLRPVILGTAAESDLADVIVKRSPGALNLCGKTDIEDIIALARDASVAVGNDTGPMHMIAPTGCPSVVLFSGHSHPHRHRPLGKSVSAVQAEDLSDLGINAVLAEIQKIARV